VEVIGKKHVVLAGLGITVIDAAQRDWGGVGLAARDEKDLIAPQTRVLGNPVAPDDPVSGVALLPSDKENPFIVQGVKPSKIGIGAIHDDEAARRQVQGAANDDIMRLS